MSTRTCPQCERVCHGCNNANCGNVPCAYCRAPQVQNRAPGRGIEGGQLLGFFEIQTTPTGPRPVFRQIDDELLTALELDCAAAPDTNSMAGMLIARVRASEAERERLAVESSKTRSTALEDAARAAELAVLPLKYQWGDDATEAFDFGRRRAAQEIRAIATAEKKGGG